MSILSWSNVTVGSTIQGKDGYTWTVTANENGSVTIERNGKSLTLPRPNTDVLVLSLVEGETQERQQTRLRIAAIESDQKAADAARARYLATCTPQEREVADAIDAAFTGEWKGIPEGTKDNPHRLPTASNMSIEKFRAHLKVFHDLKISFDDIKEDTLQTQGQKRNRMSMAHYQEHDHRKYYSPVIHHVHDVSRNIDSKQQFKESYPNYQEGPPESPQEVLLRQMRDRIRNTPIRSDRERNPQDVAPTQTQAFEDTNEAN
jgi:hypothetical protein